MDINRGHKGEVKLWRFIAGYQRMEVQWRGDDG